MMEAASIIKTSTNFYQTTWCNIPKTVIFNLSFHKNVKSIYNVHSQMRRTITEESSVFTEAEDSGMNTFLPAENFLQALYKTAFHKNMNKHSTLL
jgi:hypothetical protein